jgi:hypothetical protein
MRRAKRDDEGGGLDSLLDTMTNVVGILVIVLVVTQLGVGDAVQRIVDSIQIDARKLAEAEKELEQKKLERDRLLAAMDEQQPVDDADPAGPGDNRWDKVFYSLLRVRGQFRYLRDDAPYRVGHGPSRRMGTAERELALFNSSGRRFAVRTTAQADAQTEDTSGPRAQKAGKRDRLSFRRSVLTKETYVNDSGQDCRDETG